MEENKKDNLAPDTLVAADSAEAERENITAAATGKFRDVQTLLKAYTELEAEFTRRSQRLRELERGNKAATAPDGAAAAPSPDDDELVTAAVGNAKVRDAVIGDYLKSVSQRGGVPLTSGGGGVAAPRIKPESVKEAGRLAREFFKG